MRISNQVHKVTAIIAAVLAILSGLLGAISAIGAVIVMASSGNAGASSGVITSLVISMISTLLVAVALLRRKKDAVAGVLLGIQVLPCAVATYGQLLTILGGYAFYVTVSALIRVVANLVCLGLYALLVVECFNPGKISGTPTKVLLVVMPVVYILLSVTAVAVQQFYAYAGVDDIVMILITAIPSLTGAAISDLWMVLMGLAFSVPIFEQASFGKTPFENVYQP